MLRKLYLCGSITTDYQYMLDIQRYIELLKENKNEATKGKRVCQNSFSAKDSYHFVKNNRYQRVNNSMITVTLIFMRE